MVMLSRMAVGTPDVFQVPAKLTKLLASDPVSEYPVTVNALVVVDNGGSAGDVLPAALTAVVASKPITLDVTLMETM